MHMVFMLQLQFLIRNPLAFLVEPCRSIVLVGNSILRIICRILKRAYVCGDCRVCSSVYHLLTVNFVDIDGRVPQSFTLLCLFSTK